MKTKVYSVTGKLSEILSDRQISVNPAFPDILKRKVKFLLDVEGHFYHFVTWDDKANLITSSRIGDVLYCDFEIKTKDHPFWYSYLLLKTVRKQDRKVEPKNVEYHTLW